MDNNNPDNESYQDTEYLPSLGKVIREQREARGISVEQVATQLHIDVRHIQAIEKDDFATIGKRVFVRGYVCNYARLLELEESLVLDLLIPYLDRLSDDDGMKTRFLERNLHQGEELDYNKAQLNLKSPIEKSNSGAVKWMGMLLFLLVVIVGGGLAYFNYTGTDLTPGVVELEIPATESFGSSVDNETSNSPQITLSKEVVPVPLFEEPQESDKENEVTTIEIEPNNQLPLPPSDDPLFTEDNENIQSAESAENTQQSEGAPDDVAALSNQGNASQPEIEPEPESVIEEDNLLINEGSDLIVFEIDENNWIELRRPDGSIIISRLFKSDEDPVLRVNLPVDAIVGNAASASLFVNGLAYDLENATSSNIARLRIQQ